MSVRRSLDGLILLFCLTMMIVSRGDAQWTHLHTFGNPVACVKFLGEVGFPNVGFVAAGSFIYRSTDGGHTWNSGFRIQGTASAFCFRDGRTGWCSVYGTTAIGACYKTNDGGQSWQQLIPRGEGDDVYFNQTSGVLMLSLRNNGPGGSGQVLISRNDGSSWTTYNAGMNGFAFSSAGSGICSTIGGAFGVSGDGGQTWQVGGSGFHSWAPCAAPGTSRYIGPQDQSRTIFRSDDAGVTWVPSGGTGGFLTGCAQSTGCAVYVQATNGVYTSTSLTSWALMAGSPGNDYDTRFCVSGTDIFAGSYTGDLLHTVAAVTLWPTLEYDRIERAVTLPPGCPVDTLLEVFRNLTCSSVSVVSVTLTDSSEFSIMPMTLPLMLGASDTLAVRLRVSSGTGGTFTATLHIKLQSPAGTSDTTLRLTLNASRFSAPIVDTISVTMPQCTTRDTLLHITNTHCDSLTLTLVEPLGSDVIALALPTLPLVLQPDTTVAFRMSFDPSASGVFKERVRLVFQYGGITLDTIVTVVVTVKDAVPAATLTPKLADFGAVSLCEVAERTIHVHNTMCDSVLVTELLFNADPAFSMVPVALPVWLRSGDSLPVRIRLTPFAISTPSGTLDVMLQNGVVEKLFSAAFVASVVESAHGVQLLPAAIAVDSITPCTTYDTTFVVRNISACDSLAIESVVSSDLSLSVSTSKTLPCVLRASDSLVVTVHISSVASGSVRVHGPAFDSSVAIRATYSTDKADHLTLAAAKTSFVLHRCDLDSADIVLGAIGCGDLSVTSISSTNGSTFVYSGSTSLHLTSASSQSVKVYVVPNAVGLFTSEVIVTTKTGETKRITLTAVVLPVDTTAIAIRMNSAADANPHVNGTTTTEVYFARPVAASSGLADIQFDLEFDRDLFGETSLTPAANWSVQTRQSTSTGLSLELTRSSRSDIAQGEVLLTVLHRATVTKSLSTTVQIANLRVMPGAPRYADCILSTALDTGSVSLALTPVCGDSILARYLADGPFLEVSAVVPDPMSEGGFAHITLARAALARIEIVDTRGNVISIRKQDIRPGATRIDLPPSLSGGTYFLRVSIEGASRTRMFSVEK